MFRNRGFTAANTASLLMYFGMFGSIFLLSQFFQVVQGLNPFEAGLRVLPWTIMPIFVAPIAGGLERPIGGRWIIVTGLTMMSIGLAWLAAITSVDAPYSAFILPFIVSGAGMGLFFAPIANVVLSAVRREEEGKASGANNAIREGRWGLRRRRLGVRLLGPRVVPVARAIRPGPRAGRVGRRGGRSGVRRRGRVHSKPSAWPAA
jgi:MFS family permease